MKKQTAVEWLADQIQEQLNVFLPGGVLDEMMLIKAKQMEREQIIEAHGNKQKTKSNPDSIVTYGYTYTGEMYYNETYSK
jgi:hypothetical protein